MSSLAKLRRTLLPLVALAVLALLLVPGGMGESRQRVTQSASDVIQFGNDVHVTEPVRGDVVVLAGSAVVDEKVSGDVVVFGGNLQVRPGGLIEGDAVCFGGRIEGIEHGQVSGSIVAPGSLAGLAGLASQRSVGSPLDRPFSLVSLAFQLSLLLVWLLATVGLNLVAGREIRASSLELRTSVVHVFVLGLVAFTSFVLTAIVFSYLVPYVIGIFLLALLAAFAILAKIYGMIAVFHAVGARLAGPKNREESEKRRWIRGDLALSIIGLVILGSIRLVPVIGGVVWMLASIFSLGAALATRFGRRDPWYLADVEATAKG